MHRVNVIPDRKEPLSLRQTEQHIHAIFAAPPRNPAPIQLLPKEQHCQDKATD